MAKFEVTRSSTPINIAAITFREARPGQVIEATANTIRIEGGFVYTGRFRYSKDNGRKQLDPRSIYTGYEDNSVSFQGFSVPASLVSKNMTKAVRAAFSGNDYVRGGNANDTLIGGDGDDQLAGAVGDDVLIGGKGADTFEISSGRDLIADFDPREGDRILYYAFANPVLTLTSEGLFVQPMHGPDTTNGSGFVLQNMTTFDPAWVDQPAWAKV